MLEFPPYAMVSDNLNNQSYVVYKIPVVQSHTQVHDFSVSGTFNCIFIAISKKPGDNLLRTIL